MTRFILASQSPRRKQLLEWAEMPFDVIVNETDESYPSGLEPAAIAIHIARQKAIAVRPLVAPDSIILAADTIVVFEGRIIGKPRDRSAAIDTLTELSGHVHVVVTGVAIRKGDREIAFSESTEVRFHELTPQQIEYYIDHYQPYDKAGAYAIQEWIGVTGIHSIKGDFYNVMGLPVSRVIKELVLIDQ